MLETATLSNLHSGVSRKAVVLPVSIVLHAVVLGGALFASVWGVDFPRRPPDQFSIVPLFETQRVPLPPEQERPRSADPPAQPAAPMETKTPAPAIADAVTPQPFAPTRIADLAEVDMTAVSGSGPADAIDPRGLSAGGTGTGEATGGTLSGDPAPLHVGGDVRAPIVVRRVEPRYPPALVKLGIEGPVIVECVIDRDGNVRDTRVLRAPHPALGSAAAEAMRGWKFSPGTLNGRAVDVIFVLTVNFRID